MRLHETRTINRPLDTVFAFTADFSNADKWDPGVETSDQVTDGEPGVGTAYDVMVSFGSSQIPMRYEITAWELNERVVLEGTGDNLRAVDEIRFQERAGESTFVDYTADLRFKNWIRWVDPLMAPILKRVVGKRALDGLVEALEG